MIQILHIISHLIFSFVLFFEPTVIIKLDISCYGLESLLTSTYLPLHVLHLLFLAIFSFSLYTGMTGRLIGKYVVVYFDDILVYSKTLEDHLSHLREVILVLRKNSLFANRDKCTFCVDSVVFLGFIVNKRGVHVDPEKIKAIREWPTPQNVSDVRSFHGLASFYRRFVPNFSSLASPLNELVKKDVAFCWNEKHEQAFQRLKSSTHQCTNSISSKFFQNF